MTQKNQLENPENSKLLVLKKAIFSHIIMNGNSSLADLSEALNLSIPTVTKIVVQMIQNGFIVEVGKKETNGGRRPSIYGINAKAGYYLGVDISRSCVDMAIMNCQGILVGKPVTKDFVYENSETNFEKLCVLIEKYIDSMGLKKSQILGGGINICNRVNRNTGEAYGSYATEGKETLTEKFRKRLKLKIFLDNDSRAMLYAEFMKGCARNAKNALFVNVSWGLGLGILIDGQLYYGKSGFSGEFGHMLAVDNGVVCQCGKRGCLETVASGRYLCEQFMKQISEEESSSILAENVKRGEKITQKEIVKAALKDDVLSIEIIEQIGTSLGKSIAGIINVFNPGMVIVGGELSKAGDFLLLPIKSAIKKHAAQLVYNDTLVKQSQLGDTAAVVGACLLARSKKIDLV